MSRLGIETYAPPPRVDFDPHNQEHLTALALLQLHGRQHPTLRFKLDPTKYSNVYMAIIDSFIKKTLPESVLNQALEYAESRKPLVVGTIVDLPGQPRIRLIEKEEA
jgi:hypothetical protein